MNRCFFISSLLSLGLWVASAVAQDFQTVELDPQIGKVCYAVTAADVDGDGRLDAVAISEREAMWYRNPDWKKHVMISDAVTSDHVCIAAHDIDGDGKVDFAIGAGWPKSGGSIHWMTRAESLDKPWNVHDIGAESWTHRMRWSDVLGSGKPQLVVSPLNATTGNGVRMLAFEVPNNPVAGPWKPVVMDGSRNRVHNHWHVDGEQGTAARTIVASQEGLSLLSHNENGFQLQGIAKGASGDQPLQQGSGEVKSGSLGGKTILATIEPMHGNEVVVYLTDKNFAGAERVPLDDSFNQGHAIWCADLDGDGNDEIIAAHRNPGTGDVPGPAIFIYQATDTKGRTWKRRVLDPHMSCEDLWCADFNNDGRIDVLAGGRETHNVKLYLNQP